MAKVKTAVDGPQVDAKWRAECDLRSLMEASDIRKDPKRYKAAQMLAKERLDELGELVTGKEDTVAEEQSEKD
jgi:hypothetical protein